MSLVSILAVQQFQSSQSSSAITHLICQHSQWDCTQFHLRTPERCGVWSPKGDEGIVLSEPETRRENMIIFT